jgi:hypothetical protein
MVPITLPIAEDAHSIYQVYMISGAYRVQPRGISNARRGISNAKSGAYRMQKWGISNAEVGHIECKFPQEKHGESSYSNKEALRAKSYNLL